MRRALAKAFIAPLMPALIIIFLLPQIALSQNTTADKNKNPKKSIPAISKSNAKILETCFKCHGPGGVSQIPTHPTIAGQKIGYLINQLNAFKRSQDALNERAKEIAKPDDKKDIRPSIKSSGRDDLIMNHMVAGLSKNNFGPLAIYISVLPCDGNVKSVDNKARPIVPAAISRCVSCHGKNGISATPNTPNLAGQKRAYLRRELLLMRESAWGGSNAVEKEWRTHPIMEKQAARLRIEDVDDISNYYARLSCRG